MQKIGYWSWFWSSGLGGKTQKRSIHLCKFPLTIFSDFFPQVSFFFFQKMRYNIVILLSKTEKKSQIPTSCTKLGCIFEKVIFFKKIGFTIIFLSNKILKKRILIGCIFGKKKGYYTLFLPNCSLSVELYFNASIIVYLSLLKQNRRIVCMYVLPFTSATKTKGFFATHFIGV